MSNRFEFSSLSKNRMCKYGLWVFFSSLRTSWLVQQLHQFNDALHNTFFQTSLLQRLKVKYINHQKKSPVKKYETNLVSEFANFVQKWSKIILKSWFLGLCNSLLMCLCQDHHLVEIPGKGPWLLLFALVTRDRWQGTGETWHIVPDTWHLTFSSIFFYY